MNHKNSHKVLIQFAHPTLEKSRINAELIRVFEGMEDVSFQDLYEKYPDFHIDVREEQRLLLDHDILVLQHPFYWYSCPSILKQWIDNVLEYGFAYGKEGTALRGKKMMTAITTGGSENSYAPEEIHGYKIREFLETFEQVAVFCGMDYLPPFVVHGTSEHRSGEEISVYKDLYKKVIISLRDGNINYSDLSGLKYINDYFLDTYRSWSV